MKIISWNARGLGNPRAFRRLRLLVQEQIPHVLFLMETKVLVNSLSRFKQSLNFNNGLEVPRVGLKGGIMLLWKDDVNVTLLSMNTNHFDCYLLFDNGPRWHFSAVYGFPESENKKLTWALIKRLADVAPQDPWLLVGDLNEIFSNEHKNGGPLRNEAHMRDFRTTMDKCFLNELPYTGEDYTWAKNKKNNAALKERLDWCLINNVWKDHLPLPTITHLDYFGSDHRAISVDVLLNDQYSTQDTNKRRSRFRFEQIWLKEPDCTDIISANWFVADGMDPSQNLKTCLDQCAVNLQQWHVKKFGSMKKDIKKAQKTVTILNNSAATDSAHCQKVVSAEMILDELLATEEQYWKQRSRIDWMKSGDRNTKFFHAKASARKSNNSIKQLQDANGTMVANKDGICNIVTSYFQELFTAADEDHWALSHVLSTIPTTITSAHNDFLLQEFRSDEVFQALKTMGSDKSPGIDGMSAMFYQHNWNIVGDLVSKVVLDVLNNGSTPEAFNQTLITLIPKIKKPTSMKDFRPISLCNVVYKLVSKMLALRLKEVLPCVISETQSAFLPSRQITDNILVAFELIHSIKHRKRGSKGFAALKLDMSKAFDRVEWSYLAAVMGKMGFNIRWITLVMNCLHSNTFSFIINGSVTGSVIPQRGLRQGDPLSPYLFLICSEGLSRLLQYEEAVGRLKGLAISRSAPTVSHLLFADDSLLFCQANDRSCGAIKRALDIYHRASGQLLNEDKSVMSFSPNTPQNVKNSFSQILGMPISECHEKYLGLPAYSEQNKSQLFSEIKDRIWKLLHAWNDKLFSIGGKEVLLKAVVQSIPTYAMSCFKLSAKFCKELDAMMAQFWWGSTHDKKRTHWKKWKFLCTSKMEGGMGFRSYVHFNQALLAKQAWRILQNPDSLLARVLKARYFRTHDFLTASSAGVSSLTWQGICFGKELLIKGLRLHVGNGMHIRCGSDPWIPAQTRFTPVFFSGLEGNIVADYISADHQWDIDKLTSDFSALDVENILKIPLSHNAGTDSWVWHYTDAESYTVNSGYHLACSMASQEDSSCSSASSTWWKQFWNLNLPSKVKIFAWRVMHNALPSASNLHHRRIINSSTCSLCTNAWESIGHALFSCKHAKAVWRCSDFSFDFTAASRMFEGDFLIQLSQLHTKSDLEMIICTMWFIWSDRNNIIHQKQHKKPADLLASSKAYYCNFLQQSAITASLKQVDPAVAAHCPWTPPTEGKIKLNVDAAVLSSQNKLGYGALIRDSTGTVLAACSSPANGNFKSKHMEAKALFHALRWANQLNYQVNNVETDSLVLVNAIHASSLSDLSYRDLILDVKNQLSYFPNVCVSHVRRDANQAAHGLAKQALAMDFDSVWIGEIPPPIFSVIVNDSLNL
ncbi:uncharacterized protein LOC133030409 [Cannabis sativa]|uniref:uncharacterized protein LOC133030409 n=1 Tax=Cannabis sativa TaxID=3483 RepID=UPI0029CAA1C0|nr:uncharacterized protein LOC133030409 [Cannabis sativa]